MDTHIADYIRQNTFGLTPNEKRWTTGHQPHLAEWAKRPFILGCKNWVCMDSNYGAKENAILYSLMETAKSYSLKIHEYPKYLLNKLAKHIEDTKLDF